MSRAKVTLLVYEFAVFPARPWIDGQPARHASYCDFRGCNSAPPCRIRPGERMGGTFRLPGESIRPARLPIRARSGRFGRISRRARAGPVRQ